MATRSLKNVAKDSNKKSNSQIASKVRKSYRRSLAKVEKDIASGNLSQNQLDNANKLKNSLEANIQQSYATKSGEYLIDVNRMENTANFAKELINSKYGEDDNSRKNQMFQRDINQASIGGVSTKSKEEVKIFYASTQNYWEGSKPSERNKRIMNSLGVETLEEAWDKIMDTPEAKKALEMAKNPSLIDGSNDVKDEIGSPDYIKWLIINKDKNNILNNE